MDYQHLGHPLLQAWRNARYKLPQLTDCMSPFQNVWLCTKSAVAAILPWKYFVIMSAMLEMGVDKLGEENKPAYRSCSYECNTYA